MIYIVWIIYNLSVIGACTYISIHFNSPYWVLLAILLTTNLRNTRPEGEETDTNQPNE